MTLTYDQTGQGPDVVLLHSTVCDRRMWDAHWQALVEAGHRVVRCDFRGFGDTPPETGPYDDADDVLELLDTLGVERATLIGASYGGRVALEAAARSPQRVGGLLLLCPDRPGHRPGPQLVAFAERENELFEAGDIEGAVELNVSTWLGPQADETVRDAVRRMQRHAFEVQLAAEKAAEQAAEEAADDAAGADGADGGAEVPAAEADSAPEPPGLSRIQAPCFVVSGAHDLEDFRQIAAGLPAELPGARHLELPWAGHLPSLERPREITALMTGFLAEHPARPTARAS
ncbi:alpha/beta fold hydrolase [Streptomyces sp. NPDC096176]|uniref:alpha/beta fold hydrolase n=1 Tax=Streptomyces sp. NPDC096176 TaxID=3366079 RepID=UPI00380BB1A8